MNFGSEQNDGIFRIYLRSMLLETLLDVLFIQRKITLR